MPIRHLLVWLVAGAACWSLLAATALMAPPALLALAALVALPWLRRAEPAHASEAGDPVLLRTAPAELTEEPARDGARVLVAQSA